MRSEAEYQAALKLIRRGVNDGEIGRTLRIPRSTIRDWRVGLTSRSGGRTKSWTGRRPGAGPCFRCAGGWFDAEAYAYLLGMYLGDGCLSRGPRSVYRLRIACDRRYPDVIDEIATSMTIVRGVDNVGFVGMPGWVDVYTYWKHWPCLFPQHGPGRKHERKIELVPWQQSIVVSHPKELIRGLIHSDGNRHINVVTRKLPSGPRRYHYSRYMFTNASADIRRILTETLRTLGVHWTHTTTRVVSIACREDVAFLDTFVGPKR